MSRVGQGKKLAKTVQMTSILLVIIETFPLPTFLLVGYMMLDEEREQFLPECYRKGAPLKIHSSGGWPSSVIDISHFNIFPIAG